MGLSLASKKTLWLLQLQGFSHLKSIQKWHLKKSTPLLLLLAS
jgi:hypothetical protein